MYTKYELQNAIKDKITNKCYSYNDMANKYGVYLLVISIIRNSIAVSAIKTPLLKSAVKALGGRQDITKRKYLGTYLMKSKQFIRTVLTNL
mmetsp:Transcript_5656/g.5081  ORF Transcript_5656/g.5081 Transcript_5656/m.5081 type:complete len:91 (-) Transcript_5656:12-284(-)